MICWFSWKTCLFISDNKCGSCLMKHHLHFLCSGRQHVVQTCSGQQTGSGGAANWSAWYPVLNGLDFWLWRHLNAFVSSELISDLEVVLQQREENFCQEIGVKPGIVERVCTFVRQWTESYADMHGNHREICCRDNMNITHGTTGTGISTGVDWLFCSLNWVLHIFQTVTALHTYI
jgi:hypothetical protein